MNKNCLLVLIGEPTPFDEESVRLQRSGILANYLSERGFNVFVWTNNFAHIKKKFRNFFLRSIINDKSKITYICFPTIGYKNNISILRAIDHFLFSLM